MANKYDPAQFGITGMSPGYLQSIMEDIQRRGRSTKGQAIARGTAAGMQYDDPSMQLGIQSAIGGTQREMGGTLGGLAYQSWQTQQEMAEREKDRQLQIRLTNLRRGGGGGYRPPSGAAYAAPYTQPQAMGTMGAPGAGMGGIPEPGADLQQTVQQAYNVPQSYQPPRPKEAYRRPWMRT